MAKGYGEWLKQAEYDFKTAETMFKSGRYFYVIFMCHLGIEKTLKAIVLVETKKLPPKTHDLIGLLKLGKIDILSELLDFIGIINNAAVVTRYPEDLKTLIVNYPRSVAKDYMNKTNKVILCLRKDQRLKK